MVISQRLNTVNKIIGDVKGPFASRIKNKKIAINIHGNTYSVLSLVDRNDSFLGASMEVLVRDNGSLELCL
jgi:hypothetical protein